MPRPNKLVTTNPPRMTHGRASRWYPAPQASGFPPSNAGKHAKCAQASVFGVQTTMEALRAADAPAAALVALCPARALQIQATGDTRREGVPKSHAIDVPGPYRDVSHP
eukprot:1315460-Amorphochlora_amoeboformis.AAC.2